MNIKIVDSPFFIILVLLFIGGVGGFLIYDASEDYRKQVFAYEHFVSVDAKILESEVKSRVRNSKTTWYPSIYFRFEVEGKGYRSRHYNYFSSDFMTKKRAREIVAKYPPGKTVIAYYNTKNPKKAVIDKSKPNATNITIFFIAFFSILLLISGIMMQQVFLKNKK